MRNSSFDKRVPFNGLVISCAVTLSITVASVLLTRTPATADESETQLIEGWGKTVVPRLDAEFHDGGDNLTITVTRDGTEGPVKSNDFQAPRIVQSVEGDFAIGVTVGANLPLPKKPDAADQNWKAYVSGGLLVWIDADTYVRLERASFVRGTSKHYYANFEMWSDGKSVRMGRFADLALRNERPTRLRLECRDGKIRALAAQSAIWHELGIAKPKMQSQVLAGVQSVNASGQTSKVTFSNLRLDSEFEPIHCKTSSKIELLPPELRQAKEAKDNAITRSNLNKMRELSKQIRNWEKLSGNDQQQVIEKSLELLTSEVGISNQMATAGIRAISSAAIQSGDHALGIGIFDQAIERVTNADMPRAETVTIQLKSWRQAIRKELALFGKTLELTGKTLSGESLDWSQYKGKIVLVDFWASWCGPCRAEMPNVKEQYEKYHDSGFEVVGVCLDREREKAERYTQANELPWPSLFQEGVGWKHPMARKYNVSAIPKAILLDREGNVISISARGEQLQRLLQEHVKAKPNPIDIYGSVFRMMRMVQAVVDRQLAKQLFEDAEKLPDDFFLSTCRQELPKRLADVARMDETERSRLLPLMKRQLELAGKRELTDLDVSTALRLAVSLDRFGSPKLALVAVNEFRPIIETRDDAKYRSVVEAFEKMQRRLGLLINELELAGELVDRSDFDWSKYRGKIVLVDFWATWCGPCVAEIPYLKEQLEFYGERGFDIVSISLDSDRAKLEKFIKENEISWANLHDEELGRNHPIAKKYSIRSIPTAWLVDREGKVIHRNARGHRLGLELARLIGPRSGEAGELAVKGKWAEAAEAMKRFVAMHESAKHVRGLVASQILAGDLKGYKATCKSLWQQIDQRGPYDQANIVIYCSLLPDSGIAPKKLTEVADALLGKMWNNNFAVALAMASYRAGEYKDCDAKLQPNASPLQQFVDACFTSMAAHRLGEGKQAARQLAIAEELFTQHFNSIEGYRTGRHMSDHWMSCALAQIVLKEAQTLVQDSSGDSLSTTTPTLQPLTADHVNNPPKAKSAIEQVFANPRFHAHESDSELTRLRKERLHSAVALARIRHQRYRVGSSTLAELTDAMNRLLSSYLSLDESDQHRAEVLTQFQERLIELDRFTQSRFRVGAGSVADAAFVRTLTLGFAIRLLDEIPNFSTPEAIESRLPPLVSHEPRAVDHLTIDRPGLKLTDPIVNFQTALPAILKPSQLNVESGANRLPKLRYNAAALRMTALHSRYINGIESVYRMSDAVDGLISAAVSLDLSTEKLVGLREQELLFWNHQRTLISQRIKLSHGGSDGLAFADHRVLDAASRLADLLANEGLNSELALADLVDEERSTKPLQGKLASDFPSLVYLRKLPEDSEKELIRSLQIARCNAAVRAFVEQASRYSRGTDAMLVKVQTLETLLRSIMVLEDEHGKREQVIQEAGKHAKELYESARKGLKHGVGRPEDTALASVLHLDLEIRRLTSSQGKQ